MQHAWIDELETPCLVIDMEKARRNIAAMQHEADQCGCKLRPHIKTHKMPLFSRMQVEAGACGVTVAKVSEAEVMADGGIADIFIAYPMVGDFRVRRVIALNRRIRRLIVGVDGIACAKALSGAAQSAHTELEIRLEIDTGAGRTGLDAASVLTLGKQIAELPALRLTGIYTFKGLVLDGQPCADAHAAAAEEGRMMAEAATLLRQAGICIQDISAGSTPTGLAVAKTGCVNEIRPGTYIFNDKLLCAEQAAVEESIAAKYYCTVVSVSPKGYAVIDGGTKTFSCDIPLEPYRFSGYAIPCDEPHLRLQRMNEEHGILTSATGSTGLSVGQKLAFYPIHICTAINLQNAVYLLDGGKLTQMPVAARGMLV